MSKNLSTLPSDSEKALLPNLPASGQKDALVGTSGTPSSSNPYKTQEDTSVPTHYHSVYPRKDVDDSLSSDWIVYWWSGNMNIAPLYCQSGGTPQLSGYLHLLDGQAQLAGLSSHLIEINYGGSVEAQFYLSGLNTNLTGGGTKNFRIQHPLDPNKMLVYSAAEGPGVFLMMPGKVTLVDGVAAINPPAHWNAITEESTRIVTVTPRFAGCSQIWVDMTDLDNPVIKTAAGTENGDVSFVCWAVRLGFLDREVEPDKEDFETGFECGDGTEVIEEEEVAL